MEHFTHRVIAHVRNGRDSAADAGWGTVESVIELAPDCADGITGLEQWSHVIVIFEMHRDPDPEPATLLRRPRGRADMPRLGAFAQRGRMRPNPIGVTTVPIVRVEPGRVTVRGLDALDGTPVLDLKPYAAVFDRPAEPHGPEWFDTLMKDYF